MIRSGQVEVILSVSLKFADDDVFVSRRRLLKNDMVFCKTAFENDAFFSRRRLFRATTPFSRRRRLFRATTPFSRDDAFLLIFSGEIPDLTLSLWRGLCVGQGQPFAEVNGLPLAAARRTTLKWVRSAREGASRRRITPVSPACPGAFSRAASSPTCHCASSPPIGVRTVCVHGKTHTQRQREREPREPRKQKEQKAEREQNESREQQPASSTKKQQQQQHKKKAASSSQQEAASSKQQQAASSTKSSSQQQPAGSN
jgi:flagellar biosynthesis GTPase FlhF